MNWPRRWSGGFGSVTPEFGHIRLSPNLPGIVRRDRIQAVLFTGEVRSRKRPWSNCEQ
jgi:hypothetical protein